MPFRISLPKSFLPQFASHASPKGPFSTRAFARFGSRSELALLAHELRESHATHIVGSTFRLNQLRNQLNLKYNHAFYVVLGMSREEIVKPPPISSKWSHGSIAFKVARALVKRTMPEEALPIRTLSMMIFGNDLEYNQKEIKKAIGRIRREDPKGIILLAYSVLGKDPLTGKMEYKYFNVVKPENAKKVTDRLGLIAAGIEERIVEIKEVVSEPWAERRKRYENLMKEHSEFIKKRQLEIAIQQEQEEMQTLLVGRIHELPYKPEIDDNGFTICHECELRLPVHMLSQHLVQHRKDAIADLKRMDTNSG